MKVLFLCALLLTVAFAYNLDEIVVVPEPTNETVILEFMASAAAQASMGDAAAKKALAWVLFKQCGGSWGGNRIGASSCSQTICKVGCAMSSAAMLLASKGVSTNPGALNSWLQGHGGYSGCGLIWASIDKFGKTRFVGKQRPTEAEICKGLSAKHGLIANVNNGGHWVLLTGCKGGGVYTVNDPGYNRNTYSHSEIKEISVYH